MPTAVAEPITIMRLREHVRRAWARDTSADPDRWSRDNPAWGQCAVTALVVQDLLGGGLLRADVDGFTHYWNELPNGSELDLTWEQFPAEAVRRDTHRRDRPHVLSFPDTAARYARLRERLATRG